MRAPLRTARRRAHPRMRGEHLPADPYAARDAGSSPHARGAHRRRGRNPQRPGLIPACAGSTGLGRIRCPPTRAHPRMRGEHLRWTLRRSLVMGSSPHARGAHRDQVRHDVGVRLIPACAGSTSWVVTIMVCSPAHPRMRGEHTNICQAHCTKYGSSPHARGALRSVLGVTLRPRLIPACAGSTSRTFLDCPCTTAHPRMRGEHLRHYPADGSALGSSPHARGARPVLGDDDTRVRLIPACAGSTRGGLRPRPGTAAHPRMRGEHGGRLIGQSGQPGSSPHARGARSAGHVAWVDKGLIPACAGSTGSILGRCAVLDGSSPHARGALTDRRPHLRHNGLIPACAGSTTISTPYRRVTGAHPRMRGEHSLKCTVSPASHGSSPHARGAPC